MEAAKALLLFLFLLLGFCVSLPLLFANAQHLVLQPGRCRGVWERSRKNTRWKRNSLYLTYLQCVSVFWEVPYLFNQLRCPQIGLWNSHDSQKGFKRGWRWAMRGAWGWGAANSRSLLLRDAGGYVTSFVCILPILGNDPKALHGSSAKETFPFLEICGR